MAAASALAEEPDIHHPALSHAASDTPFSITIENLWASRYVTEGTDNLNGHGILSQLVTLRTRSFHVDIWQGTGFDTNYAELNVQAVVDFEVGGVDAYVSFNHKRFFHSDLHDNEVGAGFRYDKLPCDCFVAADWYHSFNAQGSYFEASFGTEKEWRGVKVIPAVAVTFNAGYLEDDARGLRSVMPRLDLSIPLTKSLRLAAYGGWNLPLSEDAEKFFWGGAGLKVEF